jgi:hypothetical protein
MSAASMLPRHTVNEQNSRSIVLISLCCRLARALSLGAAVCCLCAAGVLAQTNNAVLQGTLRDALGGTLPGATVTVVHSGSGFTLKRTTDSEGGFLFPALPVGEYTVSAELAGFKKAVRKGAVLEIGQIMKIEIVLEVGDITDEVNVAAGEPLLKTATAEISDVIENHRIVELPLNGRQFLQLALLSEGVIKPPGGTRGAALQQAGDLVNVAGQRSGHNIYLLDGVKVTDEYFNNLVISPSIDAIQEFKIQKSMYSPEFGGKASALINVATKSGANDYHGTLFEFVRNDIFDAKNPQETHPSFSPESIRRRFWGPHIHTGRLRREEQIVLLHQLRGATNTQVNYPNLLGTDGCGKGRGLLRLWYDLRPDQYRSVRQAVGIPE